MCRNLSKAKSCETQCEYSRDNIHEDNMMRDLKCSYCKHNLAYVSKMQTINHLELKTYRCVYCGVNYKYHKLDDVLLGHA